MKKVHKKRFQEMIIDVVENMSIYQGPVSDTTVISRNITKKYRAELIKMGIIPRSVAESQYTGYWRPRHVDEGWHIQEKVLRQLNNLHDEGKMDKKISLGGKGMGRNYTFIRWGKRARM